MRTAVFVVVYVAICSILLWVISGISRNNGFALFATGLVFLILCLAGLRWNWKKPLFAYFIVLAIGATSVLLMERTIWIRPDLLRGKAAECAYGGYHPGPGGIYWLDRHTGYVMRKQFSRDIFWSGHWWRHETNAAGYRGKAHDNPQAVFLGDSMIYGHGVDNDQTVASFFEQYSVIPTANLGQHGTCFVQMWIRLMRLGKSWQPKYVFLCGHFNDASDVACWYPLPEIERFITQPIGVNRFPTAHRELWPRSGIRPRRFWNRHLAFESRVGGVVAYLLHRMANPQKKSAPQTAQRNERFVPSPETIKTAFSPWQSHNPASLRLGWQANLHALKQIKHYCDMRGAKLILFDVGYPYAFSKAMKKTASNLDITYLTAGRRALAQCFAGREVYLRNDGHWTPLGCEIVARYLAENISAQTFAGGTIRIKETNRQ